MAGIGVFAAPAATASAASTAPVTPAAFAAQAHRAGLTDAQGAELQRQVAATVAESGGRQVAANVVDLGDGSSVRLVVPGERYVRDLATTHAPLTSAIAAQYVCPYGDFCAYTGVGYTGKEQRMGPCGNHPLQGSGWGGSGSWYNNQTKSWMQAVMFGKHGEFVFQDKGPGDHDTHGNWAPVWSVTNC
ncbi:peptidase inhibitor family I36 protein [Streptomyces sp. NPDC021356]|uniref:peptidase inhibitor family I36 protein n=1 Tax=Streptomyces sp. NPDC021356 TaxID=3154900 RepID=UPI0033E58C30